MGYLRHYDSQLNLTQGAEEQKSDNNNDRLTAFNPGQPG